MKTFLALIVACGLTACAQKAAAPVGVVLGVITDGTDYQFAHSPFKSMAECRTSAAEALKDGSVAKSGYKLGCATVELQ